MIPTVTWVTPDRGLRTLVRDGRVYETNITSLSAATDRVLDNCRISVTKGLDISTEDMTELYFVEPPLSDDDMAATREGILRQVTEWDKDRKVCNACNAKASDPITLQPCGHTFCRSPCLERILREAGVAVPLVMVEREGIHFFTIDRHDWNAAVGIPCCACSSTSTSAFRMCESISL